MILSKRGGGVHWRSRHMRRHGIISPLDSQRWRVAPIKHDINVPFGEVEFRQFSVASAWNELHDIRRDANEAAGTLSA